MKKTDLDKDGVAAKQLKLFHSIRVERDDGVIIVDCFVDDEPIRRLLPLQNRSTEIPLRPLTEMKERKKTTKPNK